MFPDMDFEEWMRAVDDLVSNLQDQLAASDLFRAENVSTVIDVSRPVGAAAETGFLAPIIGVAGLVAGLLLSGVAIGALGTFLAAVLGLGFLLVRLYGVSFEFEPFGAATAQA